MTTAATSAPGMCKLIGCPGWGRHGTHSPSVKIGAGNWDDYSKPQHCLGFPVVITFVHQLTAVCSIGGLESWKQYGLGDITPSLMAQLVDQHKSECSHRPGQSQPPGGTP